MTDEKEMVEVAATLRVPRTAFITIVPPPATVTQRTVEPHFGLTARAFLAMARAGVFPVKKIGKLVFATYEDVRGALTEGAARRPHAVPSTTAAERRSVASPPRSVADALAYIAAATTTR